MTNLFRKLARSGSVSPEQADQIVTCTNDLIHFLNAREEPGEVAFLALCQAIIGYMAAATPQGRDFMCHVMAVTEWRKQAEERTRPSHPIIINDTETV